MLSKVAEQFEMFPQVGFIGGICLPCYDLLVQVLPGTSPMQEQCQSNLNQWKSKADERRKEIAMKEKEKEEQEREEQEENEENQLEDEQDLSLDKEEDIDEEEEPEPEAEPDESNDADNETEEWMPIKKTWHKLSVANHLKDFLFHFVKAKSCKTGWEDGNIMRYGRYNFTFAFGISTAS